jgi:hypothetical protein
MAKAPRCFWLGTAIATLGLGWGTADAALVPLSLEQLIERSRFIICGEVVSLESRWKDFPKLGRVIVTDARIRVSEAWKGTLEEKEITVQYFGGQVGEEWVACLESPRYAVGEKVLVFVREWQGVWWTAGWLQGKYPLVGSPGGLQVKGEKHLPIAESAPLDSLRTKVKGLAAEIEARARAAGTSAPLGGGSEGSKNASGDVKE